MGRLIKLKATHKGNFQKDFGADVECYVLNDKYKTAVLSQRGFSKAIGLSEGGSSLTRFVRSKIMSNYIGSELREKLDHPIDFKAFTIGVEHTVKAHGYDATILIDICKSIDKASNDKALSERYYKVIQQAKIILNASAKAGIKGLVYALSGYDATHQEIIDSYKLYVREEAREYEKEFPEELYNEWYRIYKISKPVRNRPWKFKHLTMNHVYFPLAKSKGSIKELIKINRLKNKKDKGKRLHQFLSVIGVKALRIHLGELLGIAKFSENAEVYEERVSKAFGLGIQKKLELVFPKDKIELSKFNQDLKQAIDYKKD